MKEVGNKVPKVNRWCPAEQEVGMEVTEDKESEGLLLDLGKVSLHLRASVSSSDSGLNDLYGPSGVNSASYANSNSAAPG